MLNDVKTDLKQEKKLVINKFLLGGEKLIKFYRYYIARYSYPALF